MFNRKGFTLIELLIVVVIIGILAAIAIPKFAATKDKAKLASARTDVRNLETAQEAYFSDWNVYAADFSALQGGTNSTLSAGNTGTVIGVTNGYTITVENTTISTGFTNCTVQVGAGAATLVDGVITCQ
jgi:prepilin-type N-terminal cleavage/methylation domain-containing protein